MSYKRTIKNRINLIDEYLESFSDEHNYEFKKKLRKEKADLIRALEDFKIYDKVIDLMIIDLSEYVWNISAKEIREKYFEEAANENK